MKTLVPLLLLVLLTGCTTGPNSASKPPETAQPSLATVRGDPNGATTTDFMGGVIRCHIRSVDGNVVHEQATFDPGPHTIIAVLTSEGEEYVGVIQVGLPEPKAYRIRAHQRDDAITVTLVDDTNNKLVATSTAPLAAHMKFNVFVKQM